MATVKFKDMSVHTNGNLPKPGDAAPDFSLVGKDLQEIRLSDFKGKRLLLNIFPSLDTGTCAASVRRFNKWVAEKPNVTVLCVSQDLPFAQARFCGAEGLDNVITASDFRYRSFADAYGVMLVDGPLQGLMSRAVVAIDENGKVVYSQLVEQIVDEPNYDINVF